MQSVTKITVFGFRFGLVLLALYWLAIFVVTHLPGALALVSKPKVNDKFIHFAIFFILGTLMCYVTNSPRWVPRFVGIGLAGMAYAAVDEWTQQIVPGRVPDWADFIADSLGLWSAISIYVAAKWIYERMVTRPAIAAQDAGPLTRSWPS
jgi:VanZ family protein